MQALPEIKNQDQSEIIEWSKNRKHNLPTDATDEQRFARGLALQSDTIFRNSVAAFNDYKDDKGNKGSSPKFVVINFHKKVKKVIDGSVTEKSTDPEVQTMVAVMKYAGSKILAEGERRRVNRDKIKERMYSAPEEIKRLMTGDVW